VDKPQPFLAGLVWIAFFVAFVAFDGRAILTASGDALAYALIGAAFGLGAHHLGWSLVRHVPTERQVAEGKSLRRFRWQVFGIYMLTVLALLLAVRRVNAATVFAIDGISMSIMTFALLEIGLGSPWSWLGKKPIPDRPDAERV
jgi:hypothetical protein